MIQLLIAHRDSKILSGDEANLILETLIVLRKEEIKLDYNVGISYVGVADSDRLRDTVKPITLDALGAGVGLDRALTDKEKFAAMSEAEKDWSFHLLNISLNAFPAEAMQQEKEQLFEKYPELKVKYGSDD